MAIKFNEDNVLNGSTETIPDSDAAKVGQRVSGKFDGVISEKDEAGNFTIRIRDFSVELKNKADRALDELMQQPTTSAESDVEDEEEEI